MKTTLEVPDSLYRQIKSRAALRGQTIKAFFLDAVRDKLAGEKAKTSSEEGWRAVFGQASKEDIQEFQQILDEDREGLHPEDWT